MEQSTTIDVEAPVGRVWAVLSDVGRWPEWAPTVTSVRRLDDGPLAVGSRVRVEQPRIPPTEYVVTELEPGRSFSWVATGPGVRTTARHLLEDLGTGGTHVTLAVEQAGVVGRVMGRFYRRLTDRYLTAEAEGIKARSEGRV
ncbi:SRPBCC family protein [Geodermatophilus amargosae]|uniref:SRPBCC family protein n=1 Tax=Geodermatophilus amargosae TaxID=1296565 RepID=UPI0034DFB322